jgi:large subunit ribosomal protein L9
MKIILPPRCRASAPRRHRRGQGRVRPQLPAPAGVRHPWTKGGEKQVTSIKRARSAREIRDLGHANEVKAQLEELKVSLPARAGTGGRLFGSVHTDRGSGGGQAAGGPDLDKRRIELPGHIKSVGQYQSRCVCTVTSPPGSL